MCERGSSLWPSSLREAHTHPLVAFIVQRGFMVLEQGTSWWCGEEGGSRLCAPVVVLLAGLVDGEGTAHELVK
jgi:hypothetical protein